MNQSWQLARAINGLFTTTSSIIIDILPPIKLGGFWNQTASQVVKAFKGRSSRYLRQEFPELMKLPSLWTHSYMFDTTGKVSTQKVLEYINDPHHG